MDFGTILTSIKTATDIAKFLRDNNATLDRAELKLKLADMLGSLADAKMELAELQQALQERGSRITELEAAFELKGRFVRHGDAYYLAGEDGKATGVAYCLRCWETEHRQRQLVQHAGTFRVHVCPACESEYGHLHTQRQP